MSDWYLNPVFESYTIVVTIGAVLLALTALGLFVRRTTMGRAGVILFLRLLAIVLLLIVLLQPTWSLTETKKQTATFVVMLDTSRSMLTPDGRDGRTRWQQLRKTIEDAWPEFRSLGEELELKVYEFDGEARELSIDGERVELATTPAGNESAIGAMLDEVLRRESRKRLVGILLASDGNQQSPRQTLPPQAPVRRMADLGYPLFGMPIGGESGAAHARDISIKSLVAGPTVYVKNQLPVLAELQVDGFANDEIPLELSWGQPGAMKVVAKTTVRATAAASRVPVEMSYLPTDPGEYKLTVRAIPQPGELVTTNNQWTTFITVLKGGLKALYIEGAVRQEAVFARRALQASEDVSVDMLQINQYDPRVRARWPLDVGNRFEPGKYDVYIFGDIDAAAFKKSDTGTAAQRYPALEQLRKTVEARAGFMMVGGAHSFGGGQYQETPLAGLIPIQMDRLEVQNFGESMRIGTHLPGPLKMRPTVPRGMQHAVMRLAPGAENTAAWALLPPLDGANKFAEGAINRRAEILAESAPPAGKDTGNPLLVGWTVGNGRVLAFAGDTTWRWQLSGKGAMHRRFWRQVVLWLAQKEDEDASVWARLEARRVGLGRPLRFTAGARQGDGAPIDGATFTATLVAPDGAKTPIQVIRQEENVAGTISTTDKPGDYQLVVEGSKAGAPLGSATVRFYVEDQDLELDNAAADPSLIESLAKMTAPFGGATVYPEGLADLLMKLKDAPKALDVTIQTRWTLGGQTMDAAILLGVFVVLLGTEWFLRKRWGLV